MPVHINAVAARNRLAVYHRFVEPGGFVIAFAPMYDAVRGLVVVGRHRTGAVATLHRHRALDMRDDAGGVFRAAVHRARAVAVADDDDVGMLLRNPVDVFLASAGIVRAPVVALLGLMGDGLADDAAGVLLRAHHRSRVVTVHDVYFRTLVLVLAVAVDKAHDAAHVAVAAFRARRCDDAVVRALLQVLPGFCIGHCQLADKAADVVGSRHVRPVHAVDHPCAVAQRARDGTDVAFGRRDVALQAQVSHGAVHGVEQPAMAREAQRDGMLHPVLTVSLGVEVLVCFQGAVACGIEIVVGQGDVVLQGGMAGAGLMAPIDVVARGGDEEGVVLRAASLERVGGIRRREDGQPQRQRARRQQRCERRLTVSQFPLEHPPHTTPRSRRKTHFKIKFTEVRGRKTRFGTKRPDMARNRVRSKDRYPFRGVGGDSRPKKKTLAHSVRARVLLLGAAALPPACHDGGASACQRQAADQRQRDG